MKLKVKAQGDPLEVVEQLKQAILTLFRFDDIFGGGWWLEVPDQTISFHRDCDGADIKVKNVHVQDIHLLSVIFDVWRSVRKLSEPLRSQAALKYFPIAVMSEEHLIDYSEDQIVHIIPACLTLIDLCVPSNLIEKYDQEDKAGLEEGDYVYDPDLIEILIEMGAVEEAEKKLPAKCST